MNQIEPENIQEIPLSKKRKTTFAGDVLKLTTGTIIAQAITVLSAPILTRLYAPEAFGVLALFISITGILGVIACMRYELSIMLPESDQEAANLLGVSLGFSLLISCLTIPIILLGKPFLLRWLNAPALSPYLWLVPVMVLIYGIFLSLNYWSSRTKHFGRLSIARVTSSVTTVSTKLGIGYAGYATGGTMIGASVAGQTVATAVLGGQIWRADKEVFLKSIRLHLMREGIKRHKKFPIYDTGSALLNTASWQLPAFLLASFFSTTVVGYYALGFRILKLPMSLIGAAIGQVFFQRAAEAKAKGKLTPLVENTFQRLVTLSLFPMVMLAIIGRDLYVVVFGSDWAEAGVYTQILSIWIFFWFISSPLTTLFRVLEKQEFALKFNITLFITRFVSLGVGGYFANARLALILFSISGIFMYGYLSMAVMIASGITFSRMIKILASALLYCVPFGVVLLSLTFFNVNHLTVLLIALLLSGIYLLLLLKVQPDILRFLKKCYNPIFFKNNF
jgi:lipopolysaccharide exporter